MGFPNYTADSHHWWCRPLEEEERNRKFDSSISLVANHAEFGWRYHLADACQERRRRIDNCQLEAALSAGF